MVTDSLSGGYRSWCSQRLAALSDRHGVAFAASCADRQYGTYTYASRQHAGLQPEILRHAIDRCWAFAQGEIISSNELGDLEDAVDRLVPDLNEDTSALASLILDATAAVEYALGACLAGGVADAMHAGECARSAVDEWVFGEDVPPCEGLPEDLMSIGPEDLPAAQAAADAHPLMVQEMDKQLSDFDFLESHKRLTSEDCEALRRSWCNGSKSNIDLE